MVKIIAMYLPQFHIIPENNAWWGEGYTEWTAVKSAEPLFEGHIQPRVPLDYYYYDLLKKSTMEYQEKLMHDYNIYGMCFYHYWFKKGRRVLEKPAENLLQWKDIQMPFCFSWANESWGRTWSRISGTNVWNDIREPKAEMPHDDGILLQQDYGGESDWEEHFLYLLPFFKDSRYIKLDEKPLFLIYKPDSMACLSKMKELWNEMARKELGKEICFVSTNTFNKSCDAVLLQEPQNTMSLLYDAKGRNKEKSSLKIIDYETICEHSLAMPIPSDEQIFFSSFPGYDDTPRRGIAGTILTGSTPAQFEHHLVSMLLKSENRGNEFLFINAWNEWGEGMFLEPDKKFGCDYLQAVKNAQENVKAVDKNVMNGKDIDNDIMLCFHSQLSQHKSYWRILDKWLSLKERRISIADYLRQQEYRDISIYGLGLIGKHLVNELENTEIRIAFGIDLKGNNLHFQFPVLLPLEIKESPDIIIVTVVYDFENIKKELEERVKCPIFSLEEIIDSCL